MKYTYNPEGVCSMQMIFDIEGDIIKNLKIVGGCPGNTVGVSRLVEGRKIDDVIKMQINFDNVNEDLNKLGEDIGVVIKCQREEIFDMMNRI